MSNYSTLTPAQIAAAKQAGATGGWVNTNGLPGHLKSAIDAAVHDGKKGK